MDWSHIYMDDINLGFHSKCLRRKDMFTPVYDFFKATKCFHEHETDKNLYN